MHMCHYPVHGMLGACRGNVLTSSITGLITEKQVKYLKHNISMHVHCMLYSVHNDMYTPLLNKTYLL